MKKATLAIVIILAITLTGCKSKTGKVGKVDPSVITYIKDERTGLCFAIIGAKDAWNIIDESTSIGMACVPCEEVEKYLESQ